MSGSLPVISGRQAISALAKAGFFRVGQRGSHVKLRHEDGRVGIVPLHAELARGTLRSIIRQAGLNPDEFTELLG